MSFFIRLLLLCLWLALVGNPVSFSSTTLNRATTVTYPDGSYTEVDYTRLDAEWLRDRGGNWSRLLTNQLRQTVASIDPLGQVTQYGYCLCGQLVRLTDPSGHVTQWKLDAAARPIAKVYADGTETDYAYEATTSRLASVTDAKGQQTRYAYQLDGALASVAYLHAEHATPGVSYAYDGLRGRLASVTDGIGTTTYGYYGLEDGSHPVLGAGRLQSVSGPFPNQSSLYEYDALGRTVKTTVDGQESTLAFDALGRLESETNALGSFAYGYDGVTGRVASVSLPNGGQTLYAYAPDNAQERRLVQIKHLRPGGATLLDQFDYGYEGPPGRIAHWGQQQPGPGSGAGLASHAYDLRYDALGELQAATLDGDAGSPGSGVWSYDAAGNRTGLQAGGGTLSTATPTPTNALLRLRGGGRVRVAGALSEWARVQVNGQAASPAAGGTSFEALVPLPAGSQTLTVEATDASGNVGTSRYQLAITAGAGLDLGYDENGNTTALTPETGSGLAAQSLEWDACDRVVAIEEGGHRTELGYDGQGNRVRLTEKENGVVVSDRLFVDHEERDAATGQVLRRFFAQGEQRLGDTDAGSYFYARDHLGSVREVSDAAGAVRASYGYGVWGERMKLRGSLDTETGFTGYWHHAASGLELSPTRAYHAGLGRFLSQDPLQEGGGQLNLYAYCANDPVNANDPSGMISSLQTAGAGTLIFIGLLSAPGVANAPGLGDPTYPSLPVGVQSACMLADMGEAIAAGYLFGGASEVASKFASRIYGATSGFASRLFGGSAAKASVWLQNVFVRGRIIEQALGANLSSNFPVIDRFANGIATSIKSIDLGAASYQNISTLTRTLNGYIDSVATFNGRTWAGQTINASQITARQLQIAVPSAGSAAQQAAINAAASRAQGMGVQMTITIFP